MENLPEEKPPFLKTWKNVYILVIAVLAAVILLFYLFKSAYQF
jgi:hypothetical protein